MIGLAAMVYEPFTPAPQIWQEYTSGGKDSITKSVRFERFFLVVSYKTIIPLVLVGYEMITNYHLIMPWLITEILPNSTIRNIWKTVRRIYMLILKINKGPFLGDRTGFFFFSGK